MLAAAALCSLAAPSEPLPLEPALPLALKQQLQEAEWDAGERREEVALLAAGRGSEGEGLYGTPLLGERTESTHIRTHEIPRGCARPQGSTLLTTLGSALPATRRRFLDCAGRRGAWQTAQRGGAETHRACGRGGGNSTPKQN